MSRGVPRSEREVECEPTPWADAAVEVRPGAGASGGLRVGKTDDAGKLRVLWREIEVPELLTADWPRMASVALEGEIVGEVSLVAPRAERARAAWQATIQKKLSLAFRDFKQNFPEAHQSDVDDAYRSARLTEMDQEVATALSNEDAASARALTEEWAGLDSGGTELATRVAAVAELEVQLSRRRLAKEFADALGAAMAATAELGASNAYCPSEIQEAEGRITCPSPGPAAKAFVKANATLQQLVGLVDQSALGAERLRLQKVRKKVIGYLLEQSKRATMRKEFYQARTFLEEATLISPTDRAIMKAAASNDQREAAVAAQAERAERLKQRKEKKEMCRMNCAALGGVFDGVGDCIDSTCQAACVRACMDSY